MNSALAIAVPPAAELPEASLVIDTELIRKYGGNGPRYTSYPTADRFVEAFDAGTYAHWLAHRNIGGFARPLGLYVHVPFCDTLCFYCACNKIATKDHSQAPRSTWATWSARSAGRRRLWTRTGASRRCTGAAARRPSSATARSARLMQAIRALLRPRRRPASTRSRSTRAPSTRERMAYLRRARLQPHELGRAGLRPDVQQAVNRVQSRAQTRAVIDAARAHGFRSVNMDLIYGLPRQTVDGFARTLEQRDRTAARPHRALLLRAPAVDLFKPQRRIVEAELPGAAVKLEHADARDRRLTARPATSTSAWTISPSPTDDLAVAQRQGRLHRNFQGYSARGRLRPGRPRRLGHRRGRRHLHAEREDARGLLRRCSTAETCCRSLRGIELTP